MIIPLNLRSIPYHFNRFIDGLIPSSPSMADNADMVDVLVIGAGPGGGSAAIHSARAGLKTLVVEADPPSAYRFIVANAFLRWLYKI